MKQILQNIKTGETSLVDVPIPQVRSGQILIRARNSLISAGTERMLVEFGKSGWVEKARSQPDKVKQVLDKIKTDGLIPTLEAVQSKLDQPLSLGYSQTGIVEQVGDKVEGFAVGDRVLSNGNHAEVVSVSKNLCAKIPEQVSFDEAAFGVVGAIALQGVRLAKPTLGESFVVTGLGLIGLMAVQILRANGCRVLGIDFDSEKCDLARSFGAEVVDLSQGQDPLAIAKVFSRDRGIDGVLITAATKSNEPVSQAAKMCRKRGRIVLVGVAGLELSRADFYEKELSFQVSCSYGPGRYDPAYEGKGLDYPIGFVRWTEQRNLEAVLDMMASGSVNVKPLISHRFDFESSVDAYQLLTSDEKYLGILLQYDSDNIDTSGAKVELVTEPNQKTSSQAVVGFLGAGNYAGRVLIPAFHQTGMVLDSVVATRGVSAVHYGKKFGFRYAASDSREIFENEKINTVVIATRHDSHARYVCEALRAGKNVFVEKPLALNMDELAQISETYQSLGKEAPVVMVGFNRRFAPQIQKMKGLLQQCVEPQSLVMTVNAGDIPAEHWTQDLQVGGGRIIGEACHFIDLMRFLVGAPIVESRATFMSGNPAVTLTSDKVSITLKFEDGSFGTIHYLANGHKSFPKERLEIFSGGRILQLDNFRKLTGYGWNGFSKMNLWKQNKGQKECVAAFAEAIQSGEASPIPFEEILEVSRVAIESSLEEG